ncbi:MAG: histidinol-phosphatase [Clostridia bacterium]|nr:histidinol-phosphatase [Clostridia bacterium]
MIGSNIHTHTTFSDGKNTPEEMILAAVKTGFHTIGFSDHSYTPFDGSYCMKRENYDAYRAEILSLKERYKGRIDVLYGTEFDYYSPAELKEGFDYFIAGVHYIRAGGTYYAVDHCVEATLQGVNEGCGGDEKEYVRRYYENVVGCAALKPLYVAHFDLLTKFGVIDETTDFYRKTALEALDALLDADLPIEINTGAMARKKKDVPYPAKFLLERVAERDGCVILGSDCHNADYLDYAFDEALSRAKEAGVKNVVEYKNGKLLETE